jgi:hypothetical protein
MAINQQIHMQITMMMYKNGIQAIVGEFFQLEYVSSVDI